MAAPILKCPNCDNPIHEHPANGCVLQALLSVVRDRGNLDDAEIRRVHEKCDVDRLWGVLGPIVDELEDGAFSDDAAAV